MKNIFEKGAAGNKNESDAYEPDPEVFDLLLAETRRVLTAGGKVVDETDIRAGVIRAMRVAEKSGTPYTEENIKGGDPELDQNLMKAANVQLESSPDKYMMTEPDGRVLAKVQSRAEAERLAAAEREAYER